MVESLIPRRRFALTAPAVSIMAIMAVMVLLAGVLGLRLLDSIEKVRDAIRIAQAETYAVADVLDALQDAETGQRGYLLTGETVYLQPYEGAAERAARGLNQLDQLGKRTAWLQPPAFALRTATTSVLEELQRSVALTRAGDRDGALEQLRSGRPKATMDLARQLVGEITVRAEAERERGVRDLVAREQTAIYGLAAAAGAGGALLGVAALRLLASRTRLSRARDALRAQSQRLQGTVDHSRDGIAVFDAKNRLLLWNRSFFPRTGLPEKLARAGTPFSAFTAAAESWNPPLLSEPRPAATPAAAELRQGGAVLEVWRSLMPDGGQMVAVSDITRRTEAEAIARQALKMQALGQLTGGVAHDFNNLLQVISANLEMLAGRLPPDQAGRKHLDAAQSGVTRGAKLIRHLLAFARRQPLEPATLDPASLLHGQEDMLHRVLGRNITLRLDIEPTLWPVRADPQQLENAVLNLAINARDAMAEGGTLTVEAANTTLDAAAIKARAADDASVAESVAPGDFVMIAVRDTGTGMTEDQLSHALEPFYTTKPEGRGTGLGLPMVYGFARQSGGLFRLESRQGSGTTARLYLPRSIVENRKEGRPGALPPILQDGDPAKGEPLEPATLGEGVGKGRAEVRSETSV